MIEFEYNCIKKSRKNIKIPNLDLEYLTNLVITI